MALLLSTSHRLDMNTSGLEINPIQDSKRWLKSGGCARTNLLSCQHGPKRRVITVFRHVHHAFPIRLADLGVNWCRLFHLWEKAEFLGAGAWRTVDDRRVVFRRVCRGDVGDLPRADGSDLHAPKTRVLNRHTRFASGAFSGVPAKFSQKTEL